MEHVVIFVVFGLIVALWVSLISALVSAIRLPGYAWTTTRHSKRGTIVGVLLTGGVGGLYYWLIVRGAVRDALRSTPPPERPPKPDAWADDDW
jgi:hypothetical protein